MRVHVVSDIHGNADALARAGEGADALVVLGDLIDFVDYVEPHRGILGALFGAEKVRTFARLRRAGSRAEMAAFSRSLWSSLSDPAAAVEEAIREQYAVLFAAMTVPTYATPGNVDTPELWPEFAGGHVHVLDGEVAKIGGLRFGFVGGAVLPAGYPLRPGRAWVPYLRSEQDFAAALDTLGEVDVLCSHIPPAVAELTYDVVARRSESGSSALLDYIRRAGPRWSLFGHVHQPLATRTRVGLTECCNVGHFQRTEVPFVLRW
ncbi:MAG: metallophosphoesterase family protein [Haloechinothrix sp.]